MPNKPPPDDPGYEVLDGPPDDPGYEVLSGPPARRPAKPAPPPARPPLPVARRVPVAPPATPPRPKPKVTVLDDGDDDAPPRRRNDDDDAPPPKKKKKKKTAKETVSQESLDSMMGWVGPAALVLFGVLMTCAAAVGMAKEAEVNPALYAVGLLIGQALLVPFVILALVVIGSVFGIEYGSLGGAVLNLAAMIFFMYGLGLLCDRFRVAFFVCQPLLTLIGFGLFMTLFRLDVFETMITTFCLSIMEYATKLVLLMMVLMILSKAQNRPGFDDPDPDPPAGLTDPRDADDGRDKSAKGRGKARAAPPPRFGGPDDE